MADEPQIKSSMVHFNTEARHGNIEIYLNEEDMAADSDSGLLFSPNVGHHHHQTPLSCQAEDIDNPLNEMNDQDEDAWRSEYTGSVYFTQDQDMKFQNDYRNARAAE